MLREGQKAASRATANDNTSTALRPGVRAITGREKQGRWPDAYTQAHGSRCGGMCSIYFWSKIVFELKHICRRQAERCERIARNKHHKQAKT